MTDNKDNEVNPKTGKKKYITFAERYADPEYKKKQKDKLMTRVTCECGASSYRANLSHHRKTARHKKIMEQKQRDGRVEKEKLQAAIDKIKEYAKEHNLETILKL